jgi:outer membrane lipoprotein carrier protein
MKPGMMNKRRKSTRQYGCLLLVLSLLIWGGPAQAADVDTLSPAEIARNLQESYNRILSLQASFTQETYTRLSSRKRTGSGSLVLVKPGLMRWDYKTPEEQIFICDGERLLMYFAKEKQLFTSSAKQYLESDIMYSFFAGTADIVKDFDVREQSETEQDIDDSTYQIKLVPRTVHPQIEEITVWVDRASYLLRRLKVMDTFGSVTDLFFADIIENKQIDKSRFSFQPPEGTEIINQ